jgi:CO/xanthine dehydrogenase FAD-binding subunit
VMPHIATPQIRSRGTFGGSLAHADPAAELAAVSLALGGRFRLRGPSGEHWVPADEFFLGIFTTALEPDELLVEIDLPALPPRSGWAFQEVARRTHDFALAGVAVVVTLDKNDRCQMARIVFLSMGDGPVEATGAAQALEGEALTPEAIRAAVEIASTADVDPSSDIHASAAYRRHLAKVLAARALAEAAARARDQAAHPPIDKRRLL